MAAMRTALKRFLGLPSVVLLLATNPCLATTISTQWSDLSRSVAASIESYAKRHNGELPPDLDHLYTEEHNASLEVQLGGTLSEKIVYLRDTLPPLDNASGTKIIATISFPINEDRRDSLGRYIIYKHPNGEIGSKWATEEVIQASVAKANVILPAAAVYNETPLNPLDPDYAARLVEDAVKRYGVSLEEATKKAEKHAADVLSGRVKEAKTWAEVISNQAATPQPTTAPRTQTAPPLTTTPKPIASATPTPTAIAKESPASFPIVPVAICAAIILGVIVFLLRRKSP